MLERIFRTQVPAVQGEYGNCESEPERGVKIILFADSICYNTSSCVRISRYSFDETGPRMTTEKDHKPEKKKESEQDIRDLPAKKDVKGGSAKDKTRTSGRTGEIDFMRDYD